MCQICSTEWFVDDRKLVDRPMPLQYILRVARSEAAFEAWTRSAEFRAAHARAGNESTGALYLGHPKFEGFEVRQTVTPKAAVA